MKLDDRRFLLVKRGLYYRPDNCGYTGIKDHAGRYLESEARPQSGVTAIAEEDAPMFSAACFEDIKIDFLLAKITDLEALVGELGEALRELEQTEADYRHMHDLHGGGSIKTGRRWDWMRRAGDKARATLAKLEKARG